MSDKGIEHWLDRIGRLTTVQLSVEGELQEALWYAHHAGADLPTLARAAERTEEQVAEAIAEVDPAELGGGSRGGADAGEDHAEAGRERGVVVGPGRYPLGQQRTAGEGRRRLRLRRLFLQHVPGHVAHHGVAGQRRHGERHPGVPGGPQAAFRGVERAGADRRVPGDDAGAVAVRQQRGPQPVRRGRELVGPVVAGRRRGPVRLRDDAVGERREQLVLVLDVPVERADADAEPVGQPPGGQGVQAHLVQQCQRGVDHVVPA
jgi:hypothetical protein